MAQTFHERPAVLLGIDPDVENYLAWDFDQAILLFGKWIDAKLSEQTKGKNSRPKHKLADLLRDGGAQRVSIAALRKAAGVTELFMGGPVVH